MEGGRTDMSISDTAEARAAARRTNATKASVARQHAAASAPHSVLLLDDGELDDVECMLRRIGADCLRLRGSEIPKVVHQPRHLLISSMKRALAMPTVEISPGCSSWPAWVCVHAKDFLPLRERLRDLGVHFLIHSTLDEESLRLFLLQLLYNGVERRGCERLPLHAEVGLQVESNERSVRLVELSAESCRILSTHPIARGTAIRVSLPQSIGGGDEIELRGRAARSSLGRSTAGAPVYSTVVTLAALDIRARALLDRIVHGRQLGTPVSPLACRLEEFDLSEDAFEQMLDIRSPEPREAGPRGVPQRRERRDQPRREYQRRVELLELSHSSTDGSALGHDLSLDGVRVVGYPELEAGAEVTLALYAGRREEPLVVPAAVVRGGGADEVAFRFKRLSASQKDRLKQLTLGLAALQSLESEDGRLVITKVVEKVTEKRAVGSEGAKSAGAPRSAPARRADRTARAF